ncbi:septum site-determining protein MinC [Butyrivibrio sp. YAB3001]|uniref:septum site-determining protein MinC n=1 Tax=Butyrivibrio sp. YAB3001 TaxID=1520812 RepID=UPI0008F61AEE|nr:septum site-determining protein MinC [Butyrivibrio sp. YAB3001]SFB66998.1 septum site-determining protein MinC [Butyrivibrio sp. YAB3001]
MNQAVTIKGTKSGIILVLNSTVNYTLLREEIKNRFVEASGFLGKHDMGLIIRGRKLSEDEQSDVLEIIKENTKLNIICIIDEESETEKLFKQALNPQPPEKKEAEKNPKEIQQIVDNGGNGRVFVGNLRSGQDISCEQNVIVLGDVKPGANVTSYGSIFILGELRGNAFAGAGGDKNAIVMALNLNPLQVRIADAIAISPDAEKGPKIRFKRKKTTDSVNEPEVAYIENGHIVKTLFGPSFLRQYSK